MSDNPEYEEEDPLEVAAALAQWESEMIPCPCGKGQKHPSAPRWADQRVPIEHGWIEGHCPECGALL